ncbi:DUF3558 domain-containing protein [Streptomyces turgidiscabies]|uniref:Putative lipoprotein n=1 Tax=Streptomyces turgidiscabies (strain Car8) TaxID=698760 RepID=L7ETR2_STRT8|nr:hypothetical protein [Streptomyces turgidiscabies]ELP62269.1 putative lipoprotein [Streptomyces turgidiscabies Car8]MDX3498769.1 DUF3558 domain-containing protein [Streptomyces turgidiscabies]GAQ74804.1 hypothetical protein T45_06584 [Streptomyces turgidiscabies]
MQRKAYVPGVAALLAALLVGCTGGSGGGDTAEDAKPGDTGTTTPAAQPGRYLTLPEPCAAVGQDALDSLLPGIKEIADKDQREQAYAGESTLTYNTDRKVGCRWKVESTDATDHLLVDFERVVSYDNSVSDDSQATDLFATKVVAADLPEPVVSTTATPTAPTTSASPSSTTPTTPTDAASASASTSAPASPDADTDAESAAALQPRILDGLGDEAFLDDALSGAGSTAQQRTVTVAFRTSNVIVTIEYVEQPTTSGTVPDSKEMQDRAQKLASRLAGAFN